MALQNKKTDKKKVVVAMSGNIASAVSAFLLKKQGFEVIGLFVSYEYEVSFLNLPSVSMARAKNYCEYLAIPFYVAQSSELFKEIVIDPYLERRALLFKADMSFAYHDFIFTILYSKMNALKCDFISSGHYAKIQYDLLSKENTIFQANDIKSDQSFYLSSLNQKSINTLILPLGEIVENDILKISQKFFPSKKANDLAAETILEKNHDHLKRSEEIFLENNIPAIFTRNREVVSSDQTEIFGQYEGHPIIAIGEHLDHYIAGVKKDVFVLNKNKDGTILAGDLKETSYKFLEISNLFLRQELEDEFILNVEARIAKNKKPITGLLILKSLTNARFEAQEYMDKIFPMDDIVFYIQEGSLRKLIGRGRISKGIDSLNSQRLIQVGIKNELEKNPNFNFRF